MPWFAPHNSLGANPGRLQVRLADARRFVRVSRDQYDVVVADLFHPARDGAGALYSLEHFRSIQARLAPGGLFCQWLPLHQLDRRMLEVIVRTFLEVYPDTQAFLLRFNVDMPVIGLIAGLQSQRFGPAYFSERVTDATLIERLNAEQIRDGFQLFGCFLAGAEALRTFSRGAPLNTDDHPVVLFGAPVAIQDGVEPSARLLELVDRFPADSPPLAPSHWAAAREFNLALSGFIAARNAYLRGLAAEAAGRRPAAIDWYVESARLSAHFATGYAHGLTLAMQQFKSAPEAARDLLQRLVEARPERPVAAELLRRLSE